MDPNKIIIYIRVGGELVKIATGTFAAIKATFGGNPGFEVDNANLDKVNAEYQRRIDEARAAAGL